MGGCGDKATARVDRKRVWCRGRKRESVASVCFWRRAEFGRRRCVCGFVWLREERRKGLKGRKRRFGEKKKGREGNVEDRKIEENGDMKRKGSELKGILMVERYKRRKEEGVRLKEGIERRKGRSL